MGIFAVSTTLALIPLVNSGSFHHGETHIHAVSGTAEHNGFDRLVCFSVLVAVGPWGEH